MEPDSRGASLTVPTKRPVRARSAPPSPAPTTTRPAGARRPAAITTAATGYICGHCANHTHPDAHHRCPRTIPTGRNIGTQPRQCHCTHDAHKKGDQ